MTMVEGPSLTQGITEQGAAFATDDLRQEAGAPLLPEGATTGADVGERVALMIMRSANQHRAQAREMKRDAAVAEERAQREEIATLRDKARHELAGGLLSGVVKLAGAGATFGSAGADGKGAQKTWDGGGQCANAADTALGGIYKSMSTASEADGREHASAAGRAKRRMDEASDLVRDCGDHARKALDLYKEFAASKNQMQRAALHRA